MKLYLSPTSPFARIVLVTALRCQKNDLQLTFVNPWENPPELEAANPFSQVPTLLTDNGLYLNNTIIIANYLDDRILRGAYAAHCAGFAFSALEQFAKYFTLQHRAGKLHGTPHPHVDRARKALKRGLPQAPELNPDSEDWAQYVLAITLSMVSRDKALFSESIKPVTQLALEAFEQKPFMRKTHPDRLANFPARLSEL